MAQRPGSTDHDGAVGEAGQRRQIRLAVAASIVGTSIEWYDFFLYGTAAAIVFPTVFFPSSSAYAGTLESFATYAVGFAARPVGAATSPLRRRSPRRRASPQAADPRSG